METYGSSAGRVGMLTIDWAFVDHHTIEPHVIRGAPVFNAVAVVVVVVKRRPETKPRAWTVGWFDGWMVVLDV